MIRLFIYYMPIIISFLGIFSIVFASENNNRRNVKLIIIFDIISILYLIFISVTGDDKEAIEVRYEDENIWLTQKILSTLYKVETNTINYHIKKIYSDNELNENSTIRKFRIVQK